MNKSDYTYTLSTTDNKKKIIITIVDEDAGRMSVTNNIENVVSEICLSENLDPEDCLVTYKDSDGIFDGWDTVQEDYIPIGTTDISEAIKKIKLWDNQHTL